MTVPSSIDIDHMAAEVSLLGLKLASAGYDRYPQVNDKTMYAADCRLQLIHMRIAPSKRRSFPHDGDAWQTPTRRICTSRLRHA
jgi:hypothetical protein